MTATQIYILPDVTNFPFGPDYPYATLNTISHGIATFITPSGDPFMVDAEDADYVAQFKWTVVDVNHKRTGDHTSYVARNVRKATHVTPGEDNTRG